MMRIELHDMPDDRHTPNFDHGLGTQMRFFRDPRAKPTRQNDCLHRILCMPFMLSDDFHQRLNREASTQPDRDLAWQYLFHRAIVRKWRQRDVGVKTADLC
jgi:hypothetical protein